MYWRESNWVHSALRPLIGLLCQPRVIMMVEKLGGMIGRRTEVFRENLPPVAACPPHTPHDGRLRTRAAAVGSSVTNRLSYGTTIYNVLTGNLVEHTESICVRSTSNGKT
jgi:hypothetical protein